MKVHSSARARANAIAGASLGGQCIQAKTQISDELLAWSQSHLIQLCNCSERASERQAIGKGI